ncbi:40-residue YVTN family beta-propeller repeat-containing protein [Amycolatopsis regifaucium]|nr:40-residue YVTN family beta-propeller repeat-containing protein [Amycolatopsis regifaucium]
MRRNVLAGLGAVVAMTVSVVAAPAASAGQELPLPGFGDVVVDDAHERVFVSGGGAGNGIVVADFTGRVRHTIPNQLGADGLVLSADGTKLYAALSAGDAISVIDTATLTETARHPTGAGTCPTHLARTGDLIWFGYGCVDGTWSGKIGKLDPAAATPVSGDQQKDVRYQRAPLLSAAGGANGPLVAGQLSLSQSMVQVYGVSGGELSAGATGDVVGAGLYDTDITADGATLYSAAGGRDRVEAFASADLARRGAYAARPRPVAVSLSPDDRHLAAGALTTDAADVLIYEVGGVTPVNSIALDGGETVQPRGLSWSADRKRLFVVTRYQNDPEPHLEVERYPLGW